MTMRYVILKTDDILKNYSSTLNEMSKMGVPFTIFAHFAFSSSMDSYELSPVDLELASSFIEYVDENLVESMDLKYPFSEMEYETYMNLENLFQDLFNRIKIFKTTLEEVRENESFISNLSFFRLDGLDMMIAVEAAPQPRVLRNGIEQKVI